jgi:2-dehydro-3-deoxy-D-arabinonate dehydratase
MKLYKTANGAIVENNNLYYQLTNQDWDQLISRDDLLPFLSDQIGKLNPLPEGSFKENDIVAPIGTQEVWAAGVTYYRSRTARMEESKTAGGGSFYDRVYNAERPELFFKANPHRVVGQNQQVRIRKDSKWNVPEPELALVISSNGKIVGYTVGNDMSSRDIEGENPLYLPQAKVYDQSCALGPGILVSDQPLPITTEIKLEINRGGETAFSGKTSLAELKRTPVELVEYLYRDNSFPVGAFLLTGTGIIPEDSFTLQPGDEIRISIDSIGTLVNTVK